MSAWSDAGLPAPLVAGFGCTTDLGLSRTPFATALAEQAQIRTRARQRLSLSFMLNAAQLATAEAMLQAEGYRSLTLPLVNLNDPAAACLVDTPIRLTADYQVSAVSPGVFRLSCEAESHQREKSLFVATAPYPFSATDAITSAARLISGHLSPFAADAYQSSHCFAASSILQTRQFVPITMDPDAVTASHVFTVGEVFTTKAKVSISPDPDAITASHVFTSGEILTVGAMTSPNPESLTARALITGGTLE